MEAAGEPVRAESNNSYDEPAALSLALFLLCAEKSSSLADRAGRGQWSLNRHARVFRSFARIGSTRSRPFADAFEYKKRIPYTLSLSFRCVSPS